MEKVKYSIVGAGVIGLSVARSLSKNSHEDIAVFEKNTSFGQETSSRNSEVIHAGLYYPQDSLKSMLCRKGNAMLYAYCKDNGIPHKKCGKYVVSTNESEAVIIESIYQNALSSGVPEVSLISGDEVMKNEPKVFAMNALSSGSTGIVDVHSLMQTLEKEASSNGVMFAYGSGISSILSTKDGYVLGDESGQEIISEYVINCAGLFSDKIAKMAGIDIMRSGYQLHLCKGDYFKVNSSPGIVSRLIYPVPHEKRHGLGVHATVNLAGYVRLGPDTEYVDEISYDISPAKAKDFAKASKKYFPWITEEMISPDTAGMRPKLQGPDDTFRDFVIREESENGCPKFVNLIGIESPGLTSCLAIGEMVQALTG